MRAIVALALLVTSCDRAPSRPPNEAAAPPQPPPQVAVRAIDAGPAIDGAPARLEVGKWRKGYSDLCVEVFEDQTIEVSLGHSKEARISGRYTAEALADGAFRVHLAEVRIVAKQLTKCRKSWADQPVREVTVLGRRVENHGPMSFTLRFLDGGAKVEMCIESCEALDRTKPSGHRTAGQTDEPSYEAREPQEPPDIVEP